RRPNPPPPGQPAAHDIEQKDDGKPRKHPHRQFKLGKKGVVASFAELYGKEVLAGNASDIINQMVIVIGDFQVIGFNQVFREPVLQVLIVFSEIRLYRDEEQHREVAGTFLDGFIPPVSGLVNDVYAIGNSRIRFWNNFISTPESQFTIYVDEWVDIMLVYEIIDDFLGLVYIGLHRLKRVETAGIIQEVQYDAL